MPSDGSDSTMNARTLERAEKLWREAGRPPGGAETYLDEARTVIAIEDNPKAGREALNTGYNRLGPWGEPIEEAKVALENEGEFPTITDQGEQKIPQFPPPDDITGSAPDEDRTMNPQTQPLPDIETRIRMRAYQIWLEEGQPEGRDQEHWDKARKLIEGEDAGAKPSKDAQAASFTDAVTAAIDPAPKTNTPARKKRTSKSAKA